MRDFRDLKVWQKAHQLALYVYKITASFPNEEVYGIRSQLRRSCISIPTNIAEGCGRSTDKDFARFLDIAGGSASETEYLFILSNELGFLSESDHNKSIADISEIKKMLHAFSHKLRPNT